MQPGEPEHDEVGGGEEGGGGGGEQVEEEQHGAAPHQPYLGRNRRGRRGAGRREEREGWGQKG